MQVVAADPWCNPNPGSEPSDATQQQLQFEDNFEPSSAVPDQQRLADSDTYLAALERRLKRIKTNPTVLQQLAERREACMQQLLNDTSSVAASNNNSYDQLDEPVFNHELLRIIRPEQAISAAELAHLVKHDHLAEEHEDEQQQHNQNQPADYKEGEESGTESSTSR